MKQVFLCYTLLSLMTVLLFSCKKDSYKNDGGKQDPHVNMTSYEYLKSKPQFSSLIRLIDRAGLQQTLNGNITFFATTNYGVDEYLSAMKNQRAIELNNENITYTLDSIPLFRLDSLKTYMFQGKINRSDMSTQGQLYNSLYGTIPGVQFMISLRRSFDYSDYVDHVDYVRFTKVKGSRDDLELYPDQIPQALKDQGTDCQTSGIITTTGIIHVLDGYHRLFFNTDPLPK